MLSSAWQTAEDKPRRCYTLSEDGRGLLQRLTHSWRGLNEAMMLLLEES